LSPFNRLLPTYEVPTFDPDDDQQGQGCGRFTWHTSKIWRNIEQYNHNADYFVFRYTYGPQLGAKSIGPHTTTFVPYVHFLFPIKASLCKSHQHDSRLLFFSPARLPCTQPKPQPPHARQPQSHICAKLTSVLTWRKLAQATIRDSMTSITLYTQQNIASPRNCLENYFLAMDFAVMS
jgi:hypothetical protein